MTERDSAPQGTRTQATPTPWARLAELGRAHGRFETLGPDHGALFVEDGPRLLVSFEFAPPGSRGADLPLGLELAQRRGWSALCIVAHVPRWFRDTPVQDHFDHLAETSFFDDFEQVLFYGAGMGGYGAAAYSLAAPGATVLALSPQATLDPARAGWDGRFRRARRLDFTDRYGFAPDMAEAAARVFILHDPWELADAIHAGMFSRPHMIPLRARGLGPAPEAGLSALNLLRPVVEAAMAGELTPQGFAAQYRARRAHAPYLTALVARTEALSRPRLTARIARWLIARMTQAGGGT
jgi:hypothetical protein